MALAFLIYILFVILCTKSSDCEINNEIVIRGKGGVL